jgi:DTW domain-containing protein YfiP
MRTKCFTCYRPQSSCLCHVIHSIETKTKFVILIHPMERQKVKNNTGRLTHLSLKNSELIEGISFENNLRVNQLIDEFNCYMLYPGPSAQTISEIKNELSDKKDDLIFIIDGTWPCAKKMIRLSPNLQALKKISFKSQRKSQYKIKKQPHREYLSTIESTCELLKGLQKAGVEHKEPFFEERFLLPFHSMIAYQIECENDPLRVGYRLRRSPLKDI